MMKTQAMTKEMVIQDLIDTALTQHEEEERLWIMPKGTLGSSNCFLMRGLTSICYLRPRDGDDASEYLSVQDAIERIREDFQQ